MKELSVSLADGFSSKPVENEAQAFLQRRLAIIIKPTATFAKKINRYACIEHHINFNQSNPRKQLEQKSVPLIDFYSCLIKFDKKESVFHVLSFFF